MHVAGLADLVTASCSMDYIDVSVSNQNCFQLDEKAALEINAFSKEITTLTVSATDSNPYRARMNLIKLYFRINGLKNDGVTLREALIASESGSWSSRNLLLQYYVRHIACVSFNRAICCCKPPLENAL